MQSTTFDSHILRSSSKGDHPHQNIIKLLGSGDLSKSIDSLIQLKDQITFNTLFYFIRDYEQLQFVHIQKLAIAMSLCKKKDENYYTQMWKLLYQMLNQIPKVREKKLHLQGYLYSLFLLEGDCQFFTSFNANLTDHISKQFYMAKIPIGENSNIRIFNSLLCLQSLGVKQILRLVEIFFIKKKSISIKQCQSKLYQKLSLYPANEFTFQQIEKLLCILVGQTFFKNFIQFAKTMNTSYLIHNSIEIQQNPPLKLYQIIVQILLLNYKIQYRTNILLILIFHINTNKSFLFHSLLNSVVTEPSEQIANAIFNFLTGECLKMLTLSKVKALLKRFKISFKNKQNSSQKEIMSEQQITTETKRQFQLSTSAVEDIKEQKEIVDQIKQDEEISLEQQIQRLRKIIQILDKLCEKFSHSPIQLYFDGNNSSLCIEEVSLCKMIAFVVDIQTQSNQSMNILRLAFQKGTYQLSLTIYPFQKQFIIRMFYNDKEILTQERRYESSLQILICVNILGSGIELLFDNNLYQFPDKKKKELMTIEFGSFRGFIRDFFLFKKNHPLNDMYKEWKSYQKKFSVLFKTIKQEHIISSLSASESIITTNKKKIYFWQKELKYSSQNIKRIRGRGFFEALMELGGFQCLFFLLERVNCQANNEQSSLLLLEDFFVLLKNISLVNDAGLILGEIQKCLLYFSQFLWLLIRRNKVITLSASLMWKIFDFLTFFKKQYKQKPKICTQSMIQALYTLQEDMTEKIVLNLQLWSYCDPKIQYYIINHYEKSLDNKLFRQRCILNQNLQKILIGQTFFFVHQDNQNDGFEVIRRRAIQAVIKLCQGYLDQEFYNKNSQDIIERDVSSTLSILLYFVKNRIKRRHYTASQVATFQIICDFFRQVYLENDKIFRMLKSDFLPYMFGPLLKIVELCCPSLSVLNSIIKIILTITYNNQNLNYQIQALVRIITSRLDQCQFTFDLTIALAQILNKLKIKNRSQIVQLIFDLLLKNSSIESLKIKYVHQKIMQTDNDILILLTNCRHFIKLIENLEQKQFNQIDVILFSQLFHKIYINPAVAQLTIYFLIQQIQKNSMGCSIIKSCSKTNHFLIQNGNSDMMLLWLINNNLITKNPKYSIDTLLDYPEQEQIGGILGHYLKLSQLNFSELQLLSNLDKIVNFQQERQSKQNVQTETLTMKTDLLDFISNYRLVELLLKAYKKNSNQINKGDILKTLQKSMCKLNPEILYYMRSFQKQFRETDKKIKKLTPMHIDIAIKEMLKKFLTVYQKHEIQDVTYLDFCYQICNTAKSQKLDELRLLLQNNAKKINMVIEHLEIANSMFLAPCGKVPKIYKNTSKSCIYQASQVDYKEMHAIYLDHLSIRFEKTLQKLQISSTNAYKSWIQLTTRNKFWLYQGGIKPDVFYEIDPRTTGFYRLNIRPTQDKNKPYPRRKEYAQVKIEEIQVQQFQHPQKIFEKSPAKQTLLKTTQATDKNLYQGESKGSYYCQLVTQRGVYAGVLRETQKQKEQYLQFVGLGHDYLPNEPIYQLSTSKYHKLTQPINVLLPLQNAQLFTRRYILRHTAVEIFYKNKSVFLNLFTTAQQKKLIKNIRNKIKCIEDRQQEFQKMKFTEKWKTCQLNNFDYLMLVNKYSGRTFHDLGQYPVFPWVLNQYTKRYDQWNKNFISEHLRNLQYPIGKINPQKFNKLKFRYNQVKGLDPNLQFLYGTLYSNPTVLYNYFIRLQPFTRLHWNHQGQKLDHADRLFFGLQQQWVSVTTASSDMRQLTPEFYYWPQFLKNRNLIDLGKKQDKRQVHDVELPGWAHNPEQFIFKMRQALQSPEISCKLGSWIDLIFGYKATGEMAIQYDNIYHPQSYETDIFELQDERQILNAQMTISQFGQIPQVLFKEEHPQKIERKQICIDMCEKIAQCKDMKNLIVRNDGIFLWKYNQIKILKAPTNTANWGAIQAKSIEMKGTLSLPFIISTYTFATVNQGVLRIYNRKKLSIEREIQSNVISLYKNIIFHGYKSSVRALWYNEQKNYVKFLKTIYGHQNQVCLIKTNTFLEIIVSTDEDGLVLVHEIKNFKFLRQFKVDLDIQQTIQFLQIHQMGYFIILTSMQRLWIFTYMGEIYFKQDVKFLPLNNQIEIITDMKIFCQYRSILCLSTSFGNIYSIDFLEIKRFNQIYPFKIFTRIRNNILSKLKKQQPKIVTRKKILSFQIVSAETDFAPFYKIFVLYETGEVFLFYEKKIMEQNIKQNKFLRQIGVFFSQAK